MFYDKYGKKLLSNGYGIVPVKGKKPSLDNWVEDYNKKYPGFTKENLGIVCCANDSNVIAIDVDTYDSVVASSIHKYIKKNFPDYLLRYGNKPKSLYLFRTEKKVRKFTSQAWVDELENVNKLEVLAKGQQFVCFGVHPDTKQEYEWATDRTPLNTDIDDLPFIYIDEINEIINLFDEVCQKHGFTKKKNSKKEVKHNEDLDELDIKNPVSIGSDKVREIVSFLDSDDYDLWIKVGQALHHQFSFVPEDIEHKVSKQEYQDRGFSIWDEWSAKSLTYNGTKELKNKWKTFTLRPDGVTFATVMRLANEAKEEIEREKYNKTLSDTTLLIKSTKSLFDFTEKVLPEIKAALMIYPQLANQFVAQLSQQYESITGTKITGSAVKKLIKTAKAREIAKQWFEYSEDCPYWALNWVYLAFDETFINKETGERLTKTGFSDRYASILNGSQDNNFASRLLIDNGMIPICYTNMFNPKEYHRVAKGKEHKSLYFFDKAGVHYMNSYTPWGIEIPEEWTDEGWEAVRAFRRHIRLMADGRNAKWSRNSSLLVSYLKALATEPGLKVRHAPLIQGNPGDGKTVFARFLKKVHGKNTKITQSDSIVNSTYNPWAEGSVVTICEEIRMSGANRHAALDRMKAPITNDQIEITNKYDKAKEVDNYTNYILFTNFRDALPLDNNDRRYTIFFSKFNITEMNDEQKKIYFDNLYDFALADKNIPFIMKWLVEEVEYHKDFNPNGVAPFTQDKHSMIEECKSELQDKIEEMIEDGVTNINRDIIVYEVAYDNLRNEVETSYKTLNHTLSMMGYEKIGRIRTHGSRAQRVWKRQSLSNDEAIKIYKSSYIDEI